MTLDARLEVYAQIDGRVVQVISGSTSDSFLEGSGWVLTSGQLVVPGLITAPIGSLCRLSYRSASYSGAMPRPRLRVLRCTPDPMRRTTTVELGCLLSLYLEKSAPPPDPDVDIDYDSPDFYFVDNAARYIRDGLDGAGISYSGLPGISAFILKDWRWSDGYLKKVGELLFAFNYFGYMGPDEVLRFGSIGSPAMGGPSLTLDDLIDMSPLTGGTRPGKTVIGRGRYYGSPVRNPEEVAGNTYDDSGIDWTSEWGPSSVEYPWNERIGDKTVVKKTMDFTRESYRESSFDDYNKLLWTEEWSTDISYNLNSAHFEECVNYAARVDAFDKNGLATKYYNYGRYAIERVSLSVIRASLIRTEYEYEPVRPPNGQSAFLPAEQTQGMTPEEREAAETAAEAQAITAARVVRQTVSRYLPEIAVRGSTGIKYLYLEPTYDMSGKKSGERFTVLGSGGENMVLVERTVTETNYESRTRTYTRTTRTLYGPASQQGAAGSAAAECETVAEAEKYLARIMSTSRTEVSNQVDVVRDTEGQQQQQQQANPFSPSVADTWARVAVNSYNTVADTYQFYDCPATFALIVSTRREKFFERGNSTYYKTINIPAGSVASRNYAQGFIRDFAVAQNKLAEGFRYGHQISTTIDKLPITPGACFHLNHSGTMATYRVNGLNVVFDNRQCVLSVDALYWGAAG